MTGPGTRLPSPGTVSAFSSSRCRAALLFSAALTLGCPGDSSPTRATAPHERVGSKEEAVFLRGAYWIKANPYSGLLRAEPMLLLCEIASALPESYARGISVALLRRDFTSLAAEQPHPTGLTSLSQVVFYCAEAHVLEASPPRRDWSPLIRRARRRGFVGMTIVPAFMSLWQRFSLAEQEEIRRICRNWLPKEPWFVQASLPAYDDLRGWYRVTHVLFAVTANGRLPEMGVLTAAEREWLRKELGHAILGFIERPSLRHGDIPAEVLVN